MDNKTIETLIAAARAALQNAHAPYSGFRVGAALLLGDGRIVTGCNVENASSGASTCAERTAINAAVAMGRKDITAICVIANTKGVVTPCGICRQTIIEFGRDIAVICCNQAGDHRTHSIAELLPYAFTADDL